MRKGFKILKFSYCSAVPLRVISISQKSSNMNRKFFFICMALGAGFFLFACKKNNRAAQPRWSAGIGYFTIGATTWETNDTLAQDPIGPGKDLTMWTVAQNSYKYDRVFIYNMPAAASGTFQLTNDPGGLDDTTCYILGFYQGTNGNINFASTGIHGELTKLGVDSFSFAAWVNDDANPSDTFALTGYGAY